MIRYVTTSFIASTLFVSFAATAEEASRDELRYSRCLDMAARAPDRAINDALVWQNEGGGIPARHCEAIGLSQMKEYAEAAIRLEKIAEDMRIGKGMPVRFGKRLVATSPMLADMYGQAANAWLLGDEMVRAETTIDMALALTARGTTQEADLMLDRARIAAADQDFQAALTDLEAIKVRDPLRTDILILIASSARGVKDYEKAIEALDAYQEIYDEDPSGHLERGNLLDAMGLPNDARKSWLKVLQLVENGPDASAAQANIERLDVRKSAPLKP